MSEWRDIETVPRDGTRVLLFQDGDCFAGAWDTEFPEDGYWRATQISALMKLSQGVADRELECDDDEQPTSPAE